MGNRRAGEKLHSVSCTLSGNTATVLLLCLSKGARSRAGWEVALIPESLLVAAFSALSYGKVIHSLRLEPRLAYFPSSPNLCAKAGLLLMLWHYPSRDSHSSGRA